MSDPDPAVTDQENSQVLIPSCVRFFRRGEREHLLAAALEPNLDNPGGFSASQIRDWIGAQGCGNWLLHDQNIMEMARESRKLETVKEYVLAERKDCKIELQASPDHLRAWVRVLPAYGGARPTEDRLRLALSDQQICFGVNEQLLQNIVQEGSCEREIIAEGIAPVQGEPAHFEQLVKESEHKGIPQEKEHGRVDYKDLGLFISVEKGTPLLKRISPSAGTPGRGINGMALPAPPGTDRALVPGPGTAVSKEDPDVIIAARVGQPSFMENTVRVDPTLEIDSVGPSTGNVVFEGNILVRGSVESGYAVKAGQDLTILDTVEGAILTAGKNILLLTGVYGRNKSEITAAGNIEARFLNDCIVNCGGNIEVSDLIAHCTVHCEGSLRAGKHGGKGQVFGGRAVALRGIEAQIIGSMSEAQTVIEIAAPRALLAQQARTESAIHSSMRDLESVEKQIRALPDAEGLRSKSLKTRRVTLAAKIEELAKEQKQTQDRLAALEKSRIKAAEVHRGVTLIIGKTRQVVGELIKDVSLTYE